MKKIFFFFLLLTACGSGEVYGPPLPDWSEQEGGMGTMLHYEVNFLGEMDDLYLYEEFRVSQAASTPHGNTRLYLVRDNTEPVYILYGYGEIGTVSLEGSVLTFTCDDETQSQVDLTAGIPEGFVLICGQLLEFSPYSRE